MSKFRRVNKRDIEAFGLALVIFAFLLLSSCVTGNDDVNHRQNDTVVAREHSSPRPVPSGQDTLKKQKYVPPDLSEEAMQKAVIYRHDSSFHVFNNIRADYRIIGYALADTNSRKMVLVSVFTSDVKDNPFDCPYGSFYDSAQGEKLVIKYTGERGSFIQANISGENKQPATVYFEKKWVEFDQ